MSERDDLLVRAVFGGFPQEQELAFVEHGYRSAFEPDVVEVPADIIDFWNLRALGHRPLPVPVEWLDEFVSAYELAAALREKHQRRTGRGPWH